MTTKVKGISVSLFDLFGAVSTQDMGPQNTDITTQVNSTLAAGKPVFVPAGTWIIRPLSLPSYGRIFGIGPQSVLKLKDISNGVALTVNSESYLHNFTLDGNKDNQAGGGFHGVEVTGATGTVLDNVRVKNSKGSGFVISGATDGVELNFCHAIGYGESGIKIVRGTNITLNTPKILVADVAATGDGIALLSDGNLISNININDPIISKATGRGLAIVGNGSRNVQDVTVVSPRINTSNSHNVHILSADTVIIIGGSVKGSNGDGFRIEADTQNCRISMVSIKNNLGYGMRELINGSTPNNNGYMYNVLSGNSNNLVAKLGANSFVVG